MLDVTRDASGYRRYPPDTIDRIRVIRAALAIGFTLDELARIFRQRASEKPPCANVLDLATRRLAELARIVAMSAVRAILAETTTSWKQRLETTPEGGFARLLGRREARIPGSLPSAGFASCSPAPVSSSSESARRLQAIRSGSAIRRLLLVARKGA